MADLSYYNPPELMARLAGIPVYTVVNRKNEFVLASGLGEVREHRHSFQPRQENLRGLFQAWQ